MEKKIEERLKRIESYLRQADKGTQFAEACSIAQEALYDLKIAISKQPTPSSLPTDEEINWNEVKDDISNILYNGNGTTAGLLNIMEYLKSRLRTNFSSENDDWISVSEKLPTDDGTKYLCYTSFGDTLTAYCDDDKWTSPELRVDEIVTHWKDIYPPKQEQQTTK